MEKKKEEFGCFRGGGKRVVAGGGGAAAGAAFLRKNDGIPRCYHRRGGGKKINVFKRFAKVTSMGLKEEAQGFGWTARQRTAQKKREQGRTDEERRRSRRSSKTPAPKVEIK